MIRPLLCKKLYTCFCFVLFLLDGSKFLSQHVCSASVILLKLEKQKTIGKTEELQYTGSSIDTDITQQPKNNPKIIRLSPKITNDKNETALFDNNSNTNRTEASTEETGQYYLGDESMKSSDNLDRNNLKRISPIRKHPLTYPIWHERYGTSTSIGNDAFLKNFLIAFNLNPSTFDKIRNKLNRFLVRSNNRPTNIVLGTAVVLGVSKIITSEPIKRCCYFWSRAGPIIVHYRFAKWWMRIKNTDRDRRDVVFQMLHEKYCHKSLDIILNLKGLYVKIGQILSSRPDFMPREYVELFSKLQDSVPQWPIHEIQHVLRQSLKAEHDLDCDEIFESIDPIALGSASIGQVHRATLRDEWLKLYGRHTLNEIDRKHVAIKVMHPGAQERFANDFQVFRWLCRVTLPGWKRFLDELERQVITSEFDYRNEAMSLRQVRKNMAKSVYAAKVCVPEPLEELCCKQVLVMEFLNGKRLIEAIGDDLAEAIGGKGSAAEFLSLRRKEVITGVNAGSDQFLRSTSPYGKLKLLLLFQKCRDIVNLLVDVHGYQIFVNGCWNGDPHAGNFLRLEDGRIGLIDYGQTKRITDNERKMIAKIVVSIADEDLTINNKIESNDKIATAMYNAGFTNRFDDNEIMATYAKLFFDSDEESVRQGCSTPQQFFARLMFRNPLTNIPDSAVFVGRVSFLFRGLGHAIGASQIRTAKRWSHHAREALAEL